MTVIFDGKAFAQEKLKDLKLRIHDLRKKAVVPKLVSILAGDNPASHLYVSLKKKAAESIGAIVVVKNFNQDLKLADLTELIKKLNNDSSVHGIMIQLPLPSKFSDKEREEVISVIDRDKDVDGLRNDSQFLTPVVKAVLEVMEQASFHIKSSEEEKVLVVGHKGFEGRKITKVLKEMGYEVRGIDKETKNLKQKTKDADILISVTGVPNLIKADMVNDSATVIDVGSPKGDVDPKVYKKASFVSPVPGGIGPVTISCLLENLIISLI